MQAVTVLACQEILGYHAVLELVRLTPLAGDQRVLRDVPPEVIGELLVAAVELPGADHVEVEVVEHENATRPAIPVRRADGIHVNSIGSAVDGVRPAVA